MDDPFADFTTVTLASCDQLQELARYRWIYRGHVRACWPLTTTLERCLTRHSVEPRQWAGIEQELLREFKRAYHQYSAHIPSEHAVFEWLSLMQHYGAPTRFLDFTYSVHIAAYFATERSTSDAAVWAVNSPWALDTSVAALTSSGTQPEIADQLRTPSNATTEAAIGPLLFKKPPVRTACPVNPFRLNERLRLQRGVFLAPLDVNTPFVDNLRAMPGYQDRANLARIVIPPDIVTKLRQQLFEMTITRRTLFPGLDGYAQSLGVWGPVFNPDDPLRKRIARGA